MEDPPAQPADLAAAQQGRLERAMAIAYRQLGRRERTESELRDHLERAEVDGRTCELAIETLREAGYLDDARYARMLAQDKRELEGWGPERIRRVLLARGVERELVEAALESEQPEEELTRAVAIVHRRFAGRPLDRRERERALGVLLRKGYESDVALDALAAYRRTTDGTRST